jgi:V8-like Glu-specific endopeptidase
MVTVLQFLSTMMVMMRRCSVAAVAMDDGPMSRHLRANARKPQPDSGSITHPEQTQSISGDDANKRHHQEKLSTSSLDTLNGRHRRAIVGGTAADPHRFPSVVFLSDREDELSCGGTLISPTLVLTAAHCEM